MVEELFYLLISNALNTHILHMLTAARIFLPDKQNVEMSPVLDM